MEYRAAEDTDYTPITEDEIKALSVGTYYVRYAENSYYKASEETEVVIESGRKLNVQLPQGEGYLSEGVEADVNQVEYGADYAFTLKINEGYKTNDAFAVKANGETIEADSEGIYKLENITDDVEITVVGIEKDIPETTTEKTVTPTTKNPATTTAAQVKAPAKAKILKVNAKKKSSKKIKISLKKIANAKGYEIAVYASKKNAKKNKNALVTKRVKTLKATVKSKKLKNKKKLFVKVRAYTLNGKTKKYGRWSDIRKVKVK
jgi:hypothetical protein